MCEYVGVCVCVCACVCGRVCVCESMCIRARERKIDRQGEIAGGRDTHRECMYVCMCVRA